MNDFPSEIRTVYCEDALKWLETRSVLKDCSLVASLPDFSEFQSFTVEQWKEWFIDAARLIIARTPEEGVSIFFQSDIKVAGTWIDKGYLCQKAAELAGSALLWHKIACRVRPGQTTFSRCSYSHILCFSRNLKADVSKSSADVMPEVGDKTWPRGMGVAAAQMIAKFICEQTPTATIVNPFCGQGSMLAAANQYGLKAVGIERSPKRAETARRLVIEGSSWRALSPPPSLSA